MFTCTWDHVHIRSPDPEEMARWFAEMLGAEVIRIVKNGKSRIRLKVGGADVFIADSNGSHPPPEIPHCGLEHFGLQVSDMDAVVADLKAKCCEFTQDPTTVQPGTRLCFIRGPQGVSVELLDRNYHNQR
jgi:catechol 2,3-dioxygenase-like lactoylglutathione lyase family enzyme